MEQHRSNSIRIQGIKLDKNLNYSLNFCNKIRMQFWIKRSVQTSVRIHRWLRANLTLKWTSWLTWSAKTTSFPSHFLSPPSTRSLPTSHEIFHDHQLWNKIRTQEVVRMNCCPNPSTRLWSSSRAWPIRSLRRQSVLQPSQLRIGMIVSPWKACTNYRKTTSNS